MSHESGSTRAGIDLAAVRKELRDRLLALGYDVASDSHGLRSDLYIIGSNDLARALFEFKASAREACDTMYQGSWGPEMPPRFAVLPGGDADIAAISMLEQIRVIPLLFESGPEGVSFPGLEIELSEHVGG